MYWTYVLYNETRNKIYIGQTQNLEIRLKRHNGILIHNRNSYTAINNGNWTIIHKEEFNSRVEAIIREKQLKSQKGRKFIWSLVKNYW